MPVKFIAPDSQCLDAKATDTSTVNRVKATCVRQAERIVKDLDKLGRRTRAIRVVLVKTNAFHFQTKNTQIRDLLVMQKCRPAKTWKRDLQRLLKQILTKRVVLKRKAEDDPSDSEMDDSVIVSLAKLWDQEHDHDSEVDLLIFQQRDRYISSVLETGVDNPVCEEPKTHSPYDEYGWDYIDDTGGKLLNNTLVEKARAEEISVIRELGVWEIVHRPPDEVAFPGT